MYVEAAAEVSLATSVAAARRVLPPDVQPDGVTALQLLGVEVGAPEPLRLVSSHPHQVRRARVRVRRSTAAVVAVAARPAAAFVASARDLDLVELVVAGDWLVRLELTSPEELTAEAREGRGRGALAARRAAALVRRGVDSPQETRLRLAIVLAGLPEPEVNPPVEVGGERVGRVDLLLRRWSVVLEYEGDQHRVDTAQWNRDVWRHERLLAGGHSLVRITARRMRSPRAVVLMVEGALRERGYEGPAPVFDPEWRRLFSTAR